MVPRALIMKVWPDAVLRYYRPQPGAVSEAAQPAASTGGDNPDGKLSVSAVDRRSAASQLEGLRCDGQTNKNKEKEEQKSEDRG